MTSLFKTRADRQDRYRREIYTGVVAACHDNGSYDVTLPGAVEAVRGVSGGGGIAYQVGNRVVLGRVAGRQGWMIQAGVGRTVPEVATYYPQALLPTGSGSASAGVATAANVALCALLNGVKPAELPPQVCAWFMDNADDISGEDSHGAYVYADPRIRATRSGAYPVTAETLAYWKLDEGNTDDLLADIAPTAHDLTPDSLAVSADAPFFRARLFDGSESNASGAKLPVSALGACTLELWLKPATFTGVAMLLYQQGSFALELLDGGTGLRGTVITGNGTASASATVDDLTGTWHYLALTYDGQYLQLHLDGAAVGTAMVQTGAVAAGDGLGLFLGVQAAVGVPRTQYYTGALAEVRVSSGARMSSDIAESWAGCELHAAYTAPITLPQPVRTVLLGACTALNSGEIGFAVLHEGAENWMPITPWEPLTFSSYYHEWRVRITFDGCAEVHALGLLGM